MILPGDKIGIIGGGQLGKMLVIAANKMGYKTIVLDEHEAAPAFAVADETIVGSLADEQSIEKLVKQADVVTYEFENIDAASVDNLHKKYQKIPQGAMPLFLSQNRAREKEALASLHFPLAPYKITQNIVADFEQIASVLGYPFVVKTQEGGYDGKGQVVIKSAKDFTKIETFKNIPCVAESFIPFDYECSIVAVRSKEGSCSFFPVARNLHKDNILYATYVEQDMLNKQIISKLQQQIKLFMEQYQIIGILTFEAFVIEQQIYINEMAPRPHNSGHYTIEGCATSQFEQHIRAICDLPLGDTKLLGDMVMFNVLGQHKDKLFQYLKQLSPKAHLHLYGKTDWLTNRKMGHITFMNATQTELTEFEKTVLSGGKDE